MNDRPHLLIVDDDHELCSMLGEYLGPEGFATETVGTGPQALDRLVRGAVDLVVIHCTGGASAGLPRGAPLVTHFMTLTFSSSDKEGSFLNL